MACLRLVTLLPEPPDRSVPCFRSCIAFSTLALAPLLYLRPFAFFVGIATSLLIATSDNRFAPDCNLASSSRRARAFRAPRAELVAQTPGKPENDDEEQQEPRRRPANVSVTRVSPAAPAESKHQKHDEDDEQHGSHNCMLWASHARPCPSRAREQSWQPERGQGSNLTLTTRKPPYTRTIPLAKVAELADALA
jgi:hypothetical protein